MASGDTLLWVSVLSNEPPSSAYATFDTRNGHAVLDFDDSADEAAILRAVMPRHYGGGGVTAYIHYAMTSATSGKVRLELSFERIGDGQQDVDADGFAAAQAVNVDPVPATSGHVDIVSVAFTNGAQMDSVAAGESFRLKVVRKGTDATNDTASGDLELFGVELKET